MLKYIYADESGNFDFSNNRSASQYFILTTVLMEDHSLCDQLTDLRRDLAWKGVSIPDGFHATEDAQAVRDAVFAVLQAGDFRIDAIILEKAKAYPRIRGDESRFYQHAWYYLMKYVAPRIASNTDELMVIAASIGFKKKRETFRRAVEDVMGQVSPTRKTQCTVWTAASDAGLQIADYCSWAIQRKWERGDRRSYDLISDKIRSEYDLFRSGTQTYY